MNTTTILAALFLTVNVASAQWSQTNGPYGGDVYSFASSGTNLFAGTQGGVFLSSDNGTSWTAASTGLTSTIVNTVAVSGTSLFAGTQGGVFLSTNNGTSWTAAITGLTNTRVKFLAVSGMNLFAGTDGGVFISSNNGTSWTAASTGLTNTRVKSLAVSGMNLFAGTEGGVFLSSNNGTSWTAASTGLTNTYVYTLALSGTNLFAGTRGGVFLSSDNGASWNEVNTGLNDTWAQSLAVSDTYLFAGGGAGGGVSLSTNNGTNWTAANTGLMRNTSFYTLAFFGTNLFAGTGAGVFLSTNSGTSWAAVNTGLTNATVTALAVYPASGGSGTNLFTGTYAGVFLSTNNGTSWTAASTGLTNTFVSTLAVSPNGTGGTNLFAGGSGVFLSTNDGTSWTAASTGLTNYGVNTLTVSGTNLFAGTWGGGVFLSTNNGTNWTEASTGMTNTLVRTLTLSGTNLFVGTNGGVFLSTNNGTSWTAASTGQTSTIVTALGVSGTNLIAGTGNYGVFLSTDNGTSWTAANTGLPAHTVVGALVVSGTNLFAGTNVGVFLSTNNGTSWTAASTGLANTAVGRLAASGTNLFAGISASGVWRRPLSEMIVVPPNASALFNGQGSRMRVVDGSPANSGANQDAYKISGTAVTVEAWVYPLSLPAIPVYGNTIVSRPLNSNAADPYIAYALSVRYDGGISKPGFAISDGTPGSEKVVLSPDPLPTFQWTHLAGTYDGSQLRIYVNGVLKSQLGASISITPSGLGFYIGRFLSDAFQGPIEEVRLWNVARNQAEIQSTMMMQLSGTEPGLAGYWNMNTSAVASDPLRMQDQTANHNDLPIQGATPVIEFNPLTSYGVPTFTYSPASLDFGVVEQAAPSTQTLTVTNTSVDPLLGILELNSPVADLTSGSPFFIAPGQTAGVPASVRALVGGSISDALVLHTNTPSIVTIPFTMKSIALRRFDANNIGMWTQRDGRFARDPITLNAGFEWPKGSGKTPVFASGIWIAAKVNNEIRTAAASYNTEFQPGPIINGVAVNPNDVRYRVYKIQTGDNAATNPDYAQWPADLGAPVNTDGTPKIIGDQTLFAVYNDLDPVKHTLGTGEAGGFGTLPLGAEVQQTTFGFNQSGARNNTVFLRFRVINKSNLPWKDTFVSLWSDPDLGGAADDFVGIDVPRDLGFVYNGTNGDAVYGTPPPAAGYDILKGAFFTKPIQGFAFISGSVSSGPSNATHVYNLMQGLRRDGSPFIDPTTSTSTAFPLNGDPVAGTGWIDSNPGDRRFLFSTGPFDLDPGQSKEMVAAIVVGQGTSNLNSITALRAASDEIQTLFDGGEVYGGALESVASASAAEGSSNTLNDVGQSGAELTFTGGTGGATVEVASYVEAPPGAQSITSPSIGSVGNYLDVQVLGSVDWPVAVKLYYTRNDLLQAGFVESDLLGIYYWNGTSSQWILYSNSGADDQGRGPSTTGVNTTNVTVGGVEYEGFVEASAYHLTPMVIGASKKTMKERYTEAIQFLQSLPDKAFKKPADVRRAALIVEISLSSDFQSTGKLKNAAQRLAENVINHLTPQGNAGQNLWVTDEAARQTLLRMVEDILDLLQRPQSLQKQIQEVTLPEIAEVQIPTEFGLAQNYPNPFNPSTTIAYELPKESYVELKVFNMLGEVVATLVSEEKRPGYYQVKWQPNLPSGMYIYRIRAEEFVLSRKLMLLK